MGILEDIGGFLNQFKAPSQNSDDDWGRSTPSGGTSASGGSNHSFSGGGMNEQGESHYEGTGANQEGGNIWYPNDPFTPTQPPEQAKQEEPLWNVTPTNSYGVQNEPQTQQNVPQYKSGWDQIREATEKLLQPNDQQEELEPIVGDGGFLVDPYAEQEQPKPRESQTPEQPEDYWINDLGQIQGADNQLNAGIDPESTLGRRGNGDFDWDNYFGGKPTQEQSNSWVGDNGQLMGDQSGDFVRANADKLTGADVVDNGTNTYENRTSSFITVPEAIKQAQAQDNDAMVEYLKGVDDGLILNKTDLEAQFGYQSYVPDEATKVSRLLTDVADGYNDLTYAFGDMRNQGALDNAKVQIGDKKMSVRDVDKSFLDALDKYNKEAEQYGGNLMESPESLIVIKATGQELDNADIAGTHTDPYTGVIYVDMNDGTSIPAGQDTAEGVDFKDLFDARWKPIEINGQKIDVANVAQYTKNPNIINGFQRFANSEEKEQALKNAGQNVDYGPLGFWTPDYALDGMVDYNKNGGIQGINVFNPAWWGNGGLASMANMALQSAPWFTLPTQAANLTTGTLLSAQGADPMNRTSDGYNPVGNQASAAPAYALSAIGESALGSVGATGGGLYGNLAKKIAPNASKSPWFQYFIEPGLTEAAEEVTMNPFWEFAGAGPEGWYADDSYDENGFNTGEKNTNTPMAKRLQNMMAQVPEGALGGALLGGPLGAAGGVKAKFDGSWDEQAREYKLGIDVPDYTREVFTPDVQRIINHEIERKDF